MTKYQIVFKHFLILLGSVILPVLIQSVSNFNFGIWQGAVTAGLAFLALVLDTLAGISPTPPAIPPIQST